MAGIGLGRAAIAAALLFLASPAVASSPVEGSLTASGPTRILGDNEFQLQASGILLQDGPASTALALEAAGATATLLRVQTQQVRLPSASMAPVRGGETVLATASLSALPTVSFQAPGGLAAPVVRILPTAGSLQVGLSGSRELTVGSVGPLEPAERDGSLAGSAELMGHATRPTEDGAFVGGLPGALRWDEPFVAFLSGGTVTLPDGTSWATGRFLNQSASAVDPATGSGRYVFDHDIVVVTGRGASMSLAQPEAWSADATALAGTLDGDVAWTGVQADVRSGGAALPADPKLFQLRGRLGLEARFAGDGAPQRWAVSGQATFVNVDGWAATFPAAATAAAGAGLLAGLLLFLTEPGRGLLAFVLGRHAPRLVKAAPLGAGSRQRILKAIHTQQPVRVTELREATGLTRTALAYHLRILLSYEVIQQTRGDSGRNAAFMLNSGSLAFRVFGDDGASAAPDEAPLASEALAAVNSHPVRRSIHDIVQDHGPVDFEGINRARAARGEPALVQSSATHHLQALEAAGALRSRRAGRRKVYEAAVDAREARVEQYRRFLGQVRGTALVRALAAGPATADAVLERLGPSAGRGERRLLDRLHAIGLVDYDPAQRTYRVADFLSPMVAQL